jgi:CRISPR-associated protein Csm2
MSPEYRGHQGQPPRHQGQQDRRHGGGGGGGGGAMPMPQPRVVKYFADAARKAIQPDLVGRVADELAQKTAAVPASQMRRFYGDVLSLDRRLVPGADLPAEAIQAHMALLKAKAAYAFRRVGARRDQFPEELLQFFVDHAAAVKDQQDFAAFRRVFEAVIAYHKFHETKGGRD